MRLFCWHRLNIDHLCRRDVDRRAAWSLARQVGQEPAQSCTEIQQVCRAVFGWRQQSGSPRSAFSCKPCHWVAISDRGPHPCATEAMAKIAARGSSGRPSPACAAAATTAATFASGSRSSASFPVDTSARRKGQGLFADTRCGPASFLTMQSPGVGNASGLWPDLVGHALQLRDIAGRRRRRVDVVTSTAQARFRVPDGRFVSALPNIAHGGPRRAAIRSRPHGPGRELHLPCVLHPDRLRPHGMQQRRRLTSCIDFQITRARDASSKPDPPDSLQRTNG